MNNSPQRRVLLHEVDAVGGAAVGCELVAALGEFKDPEMVARAEEVGQAMRDEGGANEAADVIDAFASAG